ncbi:hypothetical protein HY214_00260 [Candidatus Roizmanbacteria bacterium]|nr:hypothetical protein [Candidatus Roizmanbacteria bacterium]
MEKVTRFLRQLFVPKPENNFRAKALHHDFLTAYLVFALVLTFAFKHLGGVFSDVLGFATDISVTKLYELTNARRQEAALPPLILNDKLSQAAYLKAQDMFAKNYWAHFAPDGKSPWEFILTTGYQYEYAGENLAKNFLFSQGVVDAWMNSPTHRENMIRRDYTEVGFATVNGLLNGEQTTLVVQMFGKPLSGPTTQIPSSSTANPLAKLHESSPVVLAKQTSQAPSLTLPFAVNINIIFMAFLTIALIMDFYFAVRSHVFRLTGKHAAHLIFIGFLFVGLLFFVRGAIL